MCVALHPWIIGQPYRIVWLDRALAEIASHAGVWKTTGRGMLTAFKEQDRHY